MKPIYLLSALLLFSLRAQAPTPVPLARGNAPGEPHHHLKIENTYVRAYYVEVPPHGETQLHQHDHDYIFVTLGDSDVTNAVLGKPEVHLQLKDGEVRFTRGGFAHVARNNSGAPFRNVTIEFLRPQRDPHNVCAQVVPGDPVAICDPPWPADYEIEPQFETAEVRLDLVQLGPKAQHAETATKFAILIVGLSDSGIWPATKGNPPKELRKGELAWFDAGSSTQFSNRSSRTATFLQLTFRDSNAQANP